MLDVVLRPILVSQTTPLPRNHVGLQCGTAQTVTSNGEVEGPRDVAGRAHVERSSPGAARAAEQEPRVHTLSPHPRRHYRASRPPPTIVRRHNAHASITPNTATTTRANSASAPTS